MWIQFTKLGGISRHYYIFNTKFDQFWRHQDVMNNYEAQLRGTGIHSKLINRNCIIIRNIYLYVKKIIDGLIRKQFLKNYFTSYYVFSNVMH